jgi:hypothetical protein
MDRSGRGAYSPHAFSIHAAFTFARRDHAATHKTDRPSLARRRLHRPIVDGTLDRRRPRQVTSISRGASAVFPGLYQSLQSSVENVSAFLWDPVLTTLMLAPVSVAFGGVGALLILLSHRRSAPLYYARR